MVVFTCGHCGESVNKPKVEKHYLTKCRGRAPNLSCMDCFKDFFGNDFEGHTKCISEEQRYSAKGFVAKVKKGEEKQGTWVGMVQSVLEEQKNAPKNVIRIIEEICKHSNTPRKKPKFINFVKNVCGHRTMPNDIEAAWDLISVKLNDLRSANQNNQQNDKPNKNGLQTSEETKESSDVSETKEESIVENGKEKMQDSIVNGAGNAEPLTKKQRKEEKKRRKYEAALQAAAIQPEEEVEVKCKKNRKKSKQEESEITENEEAEKLRHNCKNTEEDDQDAIENVDAPKQKKNKKRKHTEVNGEEEKADQIEPQEEGKLKKKKVSETEEINLHELNVASGEPREKTDKFDWHTTIISLLQKKGNEMPFKRLQKKVLAEYSQATGKAADDRIAEKLCKKLKGAPNVKVDKNRVLLVV